MQTGSLLLKLQVTRALSALVIHCGPQVTRAAGGTSWIYMYPYSYSEASSRLYVYQGNQTKRARAPGRDQNAQAGRNPDNKKWLRLTTLHIAYRTLQDAELTTAMISEGERYCILSTFISQDMSRTHYCNVIYHPDRSDHVMGVETLLIYQRTESEIFTKDIAFTKEA